MFICFLFLKVALCRAPFGKSKKLLKYSKCVRCVYSNRVCVPTVCSSGLLQVGLPAFAKCPAAYTHYSDTLRSRSILTARLPHDSMNDQCLQTRWPFSVRCASPCDPPKSCCNSVFKSMSNNTVALCRTSPETVFQTPFTSDQATQWNASQAGDKIRRYPKSVNQSQWIRLMN